MMDLAYRIRRNKHTVHLKSYEKNKYFICFKYFFLN